VDGAMRGKVMPGSRASSEHPTRQTGTVRAARDSNPQPPDP
jgi:hypothetical protein